MPVRSPIDTAPTSGGYEMDHSNTADAHEARLLITASDLALLLGGTLNELVELHLARLEQQMPSESHPARDREGVPSPIGPEGGAAGEPPPARGNPAARDQLGGIRRLELIERIRAELERLWPDNPHRQVAWLRGYLRPRDHEGTLLGSVPDELLISTYDAVRTVADRLRPTTAEAPA